MSYEDVIRDGKRIGLVGRNGRKNRSDADRWWVYPYDRGFPTREEAEAFLEEQAMKDPEGSA